MNVGLDLLTLRWTRTGMHAYVRNLYAQLSRRLGPSQLTPLLFGHPDAGEPDHVTDLGPALFDRIRHVWDRPTLRLLSDRFATSPRLLRLFDRKLTLRARRLLAARGATTPLAAMKDAPDVFHHVAFRVYPLHRVNVVTVPDLGVLGEPDAHSQELKALLDEGLPLAGWSDLVLTFSEHTKRDVCSRLGLSPDRVRVTPLAAHAQFRPIAGDERSCVLAKLRLTDRPYVLAVGMLEARKNLTCLLEAFVLLKRAEPSLRHRLVLAGVKAWGADDVFAAIARLGLTHDVRWLDFVAFDDLPALMSGADVLAHPSLYEGFGLPPLEAMACGTPVVVADAASLPEVVGDAGLLANPHRPETFASALRRVLTDAELRAGMRLRGLAQARRFSWERTATLTLAAYAEAERLSREQPTMRPADVCADRARAFWRRWVIDRVVERAVGRLAG